MSPRALRRALAALAVILLLWGAVVLFRGSLGDAPAALVLPRLAAAEVDRITIAMPTERLDFARAGVRWTVNGYPADVRQVDDLVAALTDSAAASELVARSAASHARLGVDSLGRRLVLAAADKVLLEVVVGGPGRGLQTAYVRRAGDDAVYLLRSRLVSLMDRGLDEWRERRVAAVPADAIGSIVVARRGRATRLERAENGWTVDGVPADSGVAARLLGALADLTVIGFATRSQADSLDFRRPDRALIVLGRAGDTLLALAFDSTAHGYWIRPQGGDEVYRLDFWRVEELTPAERALRPMGR